MIRFYSQTRLFSGLIYFRLLMATSLKTLSRLQNARFPHRLSLSRKPHNDAVQPTVRPMAAATIDSSPQPRQQQPSPSSTWTTSAAAAGPSLADVIEVLSSEDEEVPEVNMRALAVHSEQRAVAAAPHRLGTGGHPALDEPAQHQARPAPSVKRKKAAPLHGVLKARRLL